MTNSLCDYKIQFCAENRFQPIFTKFKSKTMQINFEKTPPPCVDAERWPAPYFVLSPLAIVVLTLCIFPCVMRGLALEVAIISGSITGRAASAFYPHTQGLFAFVCVT